MPIESYSSIRAANDSYVDRNGGQDYSYLPPAVPTDSAPGSLVPTDSIPPVDRPRAQPMTPRPRVPNPISLFDTVIEGACTVRRLAPDAFAYLSSRLPGSGVPSNQFASWQNQFWSRACNDFPPPPPEFDPAPNFEGGQCQVRYRIQIFGESYSNLGGGLLCQPLAFNSGIPEVWGEIEGIRVEYTLGGRGIRVWCRCHGVASQPRNPNVVEVSLGAYNSSAGCQPPIVSSVDVNRSDGQPDLCGDPRPDWPLGNPPQQNLDFNINVGTPDNPINEPVSIVPNDNGTYTINIGDLSFNFDGVNVSYDFSPSGRPPQSTPEGISFGEGDRDTAAETAEDVREILEQLTQGGGECDLTPVLDKLDCLESVTRALAPTALTADEDPVVIAQVTATQSDNVFYVGGNRGNSAYVVGTIVGNVPSQVRIYKLSGSPQDVEAGFGNWSLCAPGAAQSTPNSEFNIISTRQTVFPLDPTRGLTVVRVSLKPGLTMQFADPGFSYVPKTLPNCEDEPA